MLDFSIDSSSMNCIDSIVIDIRIINTMINVSCIHSIVVSGEIRSRRRFRRGKRGESTSNAAYSFGWLSIFSDDTFVQRLLRSWNSIVHV